MHRKQTSASHAGSQPKRDGGVPNTGYRGPFRLRYIALIIAMPPDANAASPTPSSALLKRS